MLVLVSCLFGGKNIEGDEAGECGDGADDDRDGDFDCDDTDCVGSPECEGGVSTVVEPTTDSDYPCEVSIVEPAEGSEIALDDACGLTVTFSVSVGELALAEPGGDDEIGVGYLEMCVGTACADVTASATDLTTSGFLPGPTEVTVRCKHLSGRDMDAGPDWEDSANVTIVDNAAGSCGV